MTITNDAWFGDSAAPVSTSPRPSSAPPRPDASWSAAPTTGISGVVAPTGLIEHQTPTFQVDSFTAPIAPRTAPTVYTRFGNVVPIGDSC